MYRLERCLVEDFEGNIKRADNVFAISDFALEFFYINGRTDIIALTNDGNLIAFEAKLNRWRIAMNQAYRNSAFAHYSYVLIPKNFIDNVLRHQHESERRGVGLCSVDPSGIEIEIFSKRKEPIQPWLTNAALSYIAGVYDESG
jgi:hypothetical protein